MDRSAREVVRDEVQAATAARRTLARVARPSIEAAELRRAARAQQASVARWLRRLSSSRA